MDTTHPTSEELREWAFNGGRVEPCPDWELVLCWQMDRGRLRMCIELAADPHCPAATFFLNVLYQWTAFVAQQRNFAAMRRAYGEWLTEARGVQDCRVKNWRRWTTLFFQSGEPLNQQDWRRLWSDELSGGADE
jgi:hypothetical protein